MEPRLYYLPAWLTNLPSPIGLNELIQILTLVAHSSTNLYKRDARPRPAIALQEGDRYTEVTCRLSAIEHVPFTSLDIRHFPLHDFLQGQKKDGGASCWKLFAVLEVGAGLDRLRKVQAKISRENLGLSTVTT